MLTVILCSILFFGLTFSAVSAADKVQTIWQLAYWSNYDTACTILLDEDRTPTNEEIQRACGDALYQTWLTTPLCENTYGSDPSKAACTGVFLRRVGQQTVVDSYEAALAELQQKNLSQIRFDVTNINCDPGELCVDKPQILLIAHGPENDSMIRTVHIRIGTFEGACDGNACQMKLPASDEAGAWLEYWAMDSDGNQSNHFWIKFRAVPLQNGGQTVYRYDVLGDAFPDEGAYGSDVWYIFPAVGTEMDPLLEKVPTAEYLVTKHKLRLLAAKLINFGKADTSMCQNYGLNLDGTPNGCGEEQTALAVYEYQNRYDLLIYDAAKRQKVPARLVKGLIAQESQFWPGSSDNPYEYGLGCITESGTDMLLRWNSAYYLKICTNAYPLNRDSCYSGFSGLDEKKQIALRGVVISKVGTDEEIEMLAAAIRGSVYQVNQIVANATGETASAVSTYEDMWKFTIANYYSGSGCLYNAMTQVNSYGMKLTWENVRRYMTGKCALADQYVDRVYELGY